MMKFVYKRNFNCVEVTKDVTLQVLNDKFMINTNTHIHIADYFLEISVFYE